MIRYRYLIALLLLVPTMPGAARGEDRELSSAERGPKPAAIEPPSRAEIDASVRRGVAFLLDNQNANGSWGSARHTKGLNIYAPVPGSHRAFHYATTALCIAALIEVEQAPPGEALLAEAERLARSIDRSEAFLLENLPRLRRGSADALYNNWGHAYGISALARMHGRRPDDEERRLRIEGAVRQQIDMLGRYEYVGGGWGYYDFAHHTQRPAGSATSFTTATVLVALFEARQIGVDVPEGLIERGKASILRQRAGDFTYAYSDRFDLKIRPMHPVNRRGGSLGRSQACNAALRVWGDRSVTDRVLETWLDRLYARNLWLDMGRKRPIPHESWFQVAGYFFYYGHYYAAVCIDQLPPERRRHFQDHLAAILIGVQEKDGSWWDFPLYDYHQAYGTGFGLMTLLRCR